ncbi:MAG TPA: AAA family ATPase [Euzebyales bacterium]|nr:AAA family ATPase [Euzebyales bacterium]
MPGSAWLTDDGRIDGRMPDHVGRTHCAELWFTADRVYKRKRPVALGFLDFTTLAARRTASQREVELNRRLAPDVYLGVVDVHDVAGATVDVAVEMRRLPDDRRLATLAAAGAEVDGCVRSIARQIAVFHAAQPPAAHPERYAGVTALRANWEDNLEVLRAHGDAIPAPQVAALAADVERYLDGRRPLFGSRIAAGMVRDGHGDLQAGDIFCLPDGPRVLDCLEFSDRYRIGDVLLDTAFLVMDLERLGRPDLARALLDTYRELTDARHPLSLVHHHVAYRAGVRAKVACLSADADATGEQASLLTTLAVDHLRRGRVRLVVVGGLPGTGKSTLAADLSRRHGWALLRTDEVRKDLVGIAHGRAGGATAYRPDVTAATYTEVVRRAERLLGMGESVVLDGSWSAAGHRADAAAVAARTSSELWQLRCHVAPAIAHARLAGRSDDASDATPAVHDEMATRFAPWDDAVVITTAATPAAVADVVDRAIGLPPHPDE